MRSLNLIASQREVIESDGAVGEGPATIRMMWVNSTLINLSNSTSFSRTE